MPLVDRFGKEIKQDKPIEEEVSAGAVTAVRNNFSSYPSQGLTPERLTTIFRDADTGIVLNQMELYEEMEEKETQLSSVLQTRKLAVSGLDWEVSPASDDARDVDIAAFVMEALKHAPGFTDMLLNALDAVGKGYSVNEIVWLIEPDAVTVERFKYWHPKAFTFYGRDNILTEEPMLVTDDEPVYGEPLPPNKFIFHRSHSRSGVTPRGGVLRPSAWLYLFKNYTLKDWVISNERFAMPLRLGKFGPGASDKDVDVLMDAVYNLGTDAAAVINDATMIEFIEKKASQGKDNAYQSLVEYVDGSFSKLVLGHSGSSDSTAGRLGNDEQAGEVREDLVTADAHDLADTLTENLVRPLVLFNYGPDAAVPFFRFLIEDEQDMVANSSVIKNLTEAGVNTIPVSHVHEQFGIPLPAEGDDTIQPVARGAFKDGCGCGCSDSVAVRVASKTPHIKGRYALQELNELGSKIIACREPAERASLYKEYSERVERLNDIDAELMAMAELPATDSEWRGEYLSRIQPMLTGMNDEAIRATESYINSLPTPPTVDQFAERVKFETGEAFSKTDERAIRAVVDDMYRFYKSTGGITPGVEVAFGGSDVRAINSLSQFDNSTFSKFIKNPASQATLDTFLREQYLEQGEGLFGAGNRQAVNELTTLLSQELSDISNSQVSRIVDTSVQRTRNWAATEQLHNAAIVEIEIVEPTQQCEFCQAMNGQIIRVDRAHETLQRMKDMSTSEFEAFLKSNKAILENAEDFVDSGMLPPYHPHCHGRIIKRVV
jgi:phage gp29-like protein